MPQYEYECERGHRFSRFVIRPESNEPIETVPCEDKLCIRALRRKDAKLVPSRTGTPILKAGVGGFYKPNAR